MGKAIHASDVVLPEGAKLTTALGAKLRVKVTKAPAIILGDKDPGARNADRVPAAFGASSFAMPKSSSFTSPPSVTRMLDGLRSR